MAKTRIPADELKCVYETLVEMAPKLESLLAHPLMSSPGGGDDEGGPGYEICPGTQVCGGAFAPCDTRSAECPTQHQPSSCNPEVCHPAQTCSGGHACPNHSCAPTFACAPGFAHGRAAESAGESQGRHPIWRAISEKLDGRSLQ